MEWSPSSVKNVVGIGAVASVLVVVLFATLQSASPQVQAGAGIGLVVAAFIASMIATNRRSEQRVLHSHHRVAHIPLPHRTEQRAA